jgi:peptide/nickel transport system substrate-binding protein
MMRFRWMALVLVVLLVGMGLAAGAQGEVINVGFRGDPGNVDPAATMPTNNTWFLFYNVFERLVRADKDDPNNVVGVLAVSWETNADGSLWTFKLRESVEFHDGTKFNAEAVKYSFERLMGIALGPSEWFADVIDTVTVVDDYTVTFTLKKAYPLFPSLLSALDGPYIISPTAYKAQATTDDPWSRTWASENMVGTGPYIITDWVREQYVVLGAFDGYWGGWEGEHFTQINYKVVREPSSRKLGLLTGTLDYAEDISYTDIPSLVMNPDVVVHPNSTTQLWMIHLNNGRPPFDDAVVRQAVSYAFPYDATIQYIFQGYAVQAQGGLGRGLLYHNPNAIMYSTDLEKAKGLLAQAGYTDGGFTLELLYISGLDFQRQIAEAFQANLAELGITLEIRNYPWSTLVEMNSLPVSERPYMSIRYNAPDFNDPFSQTFKPIYECGQSWNWSAYCSAEYDALLKEAETTTDAAELQRIAYRMQELMTEEAASIYIAEGSQVAGLGVDIEGYYSIAFYPGIAYIYDMYRSK